MGLKKLFVLTVALLLLVASSQAFAAGSGLVLYLPFDGDLKDHSGNENNGVIKGTEKWINGKFGKAMEFDGATYVEVPDKNNSGFDNVPGLTIEVWVKMENHHDNGIVVKLATPDAYWPCSYNLETWSDQLAYFDVGADAGSYATANYPLNEWFHIAGVFDGNKGEDRLYVNGDLKSTNPRKEKIVPDGDLPVYIGCVAPGQLFFKGALDDLVIYSRILTQTEIMEDIKAIAASVVSKNKLVTTWAGIKGLR